MFLAFLILFINKSWKEVLARWRDLGPQLAVRDAGFAQFVESRNELLPIPQLCNSVGHLCKQEEFLLQDRLRKFIFDGCESKTLIATHRKCNNNDRLQNLITGYATKNFNRYTIMVNLYRKIALIEAVSYLVLLFVAMPIKYLLSVPEPVKYLGWVHGILFIAFSTLLIACWIKYRWSILRVTGYFLGSFVPFVPFGLDRRLKAEYGELR